MPCTGNAVRLALGRQYSRDLRISPDLPTLLQKQYYIAFSLQILFLYGLVYVCTT